MLFSAAFFRIHKISILFSIICLGFYGVFAYDLVRTDYVKLLSLYGALFFLFYKLIQINKHNTTLLSYIAFAFRAVFIFAIPNLSQDFYRFIWDGRMILEGYNPYLYTVDSFILNGEFPVSQAKELYDGMGNLNASHFTNYPPINQLCFVIAGLFSGNSILGSVIVMRLILIAADFGILYFGKRLLEKLKKPSHLIFWYLLNPFIIIELTGNLHFESLMLFFLIWSLYLLYKGKWQWAAILFALSVSVKLIPLIFLPLFYQWFVKKGSDKVTSNSVTEVTRSDSQKSHDVIATSLPPRKDKKKIPALAGITRLIGFYSLTAITILLLFTPFYSSQFISNYAETVGLWFKNFEFNASLYYIAREIGYLFRGYNEIAIIGKYSAIIVFLFVLSIAFLRRNKSLVGLISAMLLVLSFYYFTATTVHPWYVATLLLLSVFTKYKYPLVWSFVIILSYLAYLNLGNANKSENLWIIAIEYLVVYSVFIWELFFKRSTTSSNY